MKETASNAKLFADPKIFSSPAVVPMSHPSIVRHYVTRPSVPLFFRQDVLAIEAALMMVVVIAGSRAGETDAASVNPRVTPPTCAVLVHQGKDLTLDVDLSECPILHDLPVDRRRPWQCRRRGRI